MTLTLDEVRKTRFHMARRQGYEVTDVDNFVDKVEATLQAMTEENEALKKKAESGSPAPVAAAPVVDTKAIEENKRLADENKRLAMELAEARRNAGAPQQLQDSLKRAQDEAERLRAENQTLRTQLEDAKKVVPAATPAPVAAAAVAGAGVQKVVVSTAADASPQVTRMVELAIKQSEQVVAEAEAEAKRKVDDANRQAHEITVDARTKADRIESEARVNSEKMTSEAQSRAAALDGETKARRTELFAALEQERDTLKVKVGELRDFEGSYRKNLSSHLKSQIEALDKGIFEPGKAPGLLSEPAKAGEKNDSTTPRLDALLGEQH